jgi:hypothetical protein
MKGLSDHSNLSFRIVYCGNLGVGRIPPLCEVARMLAAVNDMATLDIYGRFVSEEDKRSLCAYPNVRYFGVIPYAEIPRVMSEANLLLHVENPERLVNLRYAFSTKIADSLASGRPFLVYASREYPFVQYLEKHSAAHIAEGEAELAEVLRVCMENSDALNSHISAALTLAAEKHNIVNNAERFRQIVEQQVSVEEPVGESK